MWRCVMYCSLFQRANAFTHWHKLYHAVMVELFPSILRLISSLCSDFQFTLILPIISSFQAFHFSLTPVSATDLCGCFSKFIWPGDSKICLHWSNRHARSSWGCLNPGVVFVFLWLSSCNNMNVEIIIIIYCKWVVTRWQCYFTCVQNVKLVTN